MRSRTTRSARALARGPAIACRAGSPMSVYDAAPDDSIEGSIDARAAPTGRSRWRRRCCSGSRWPCRRCAAGATIPGRSCATLLFADRPIQDGAGVIALDAPVRAYDAAVVPLTITALMPQTARALHQDPAPRDRPQPGADRGRVPSDARQRHRDHRDPGADQRVHPRPRRSPRPATASSTWRAASSRRPAAARRRRSRTATAALARLGQMKLKHGRSASGEPNQVQLLISHPNYTGMQMDQLSRNWIPPHYVQTIEARYDGRRCSRSTPTSA